MNKYFYIANKYNIKLAGMIEPPPKLLNIIIRNVDENVLKINYIQAQEDENISLSLFCSELLGSNKFNINKSGFVYIINQDILKGWKYLDNEMILFLKNNVDYKLEIHFVINDNVYIDNKPVAASFEFGKISIIELPIICSTTVNGLKESLGKINQSIKHELIHFSQDLLNHVKNLQNKNENYIIHELRDNEFYTNLQDQIDYFLKKYKNNESLEKQIKTFIQTSANFRILKENNVNKWKKAVKEFYKVVKDKL